MTARVLLAALALVLAACGAAPASGDPGYGATPQLPEPGAGPLPAINAAPAVGWPDGGALAAPAGFTVSRYAENLDHPRWLYLLPNGDVLVAQGATRATRGGGIVGWVSNMVQRRAGALGESPGEIILLRDSNSDGAVDERHTFAEHLNQPFGMALLGDYFYVANTDAVLRFPYTSGAVHAPGQGEAIVSLPFRAGDNGHWTRNLAVSPDGAKIYVSVGSSSNIAERGMAAEARRAAIWRFNRDGSGAEIFATGLRNPVGLEFEPVSGALWTAVNERDMLGDDLVPDYMTSVRQGGFYGWPYSYFGQHVDRRVRPQNPALVARAIAPDYALGAHTASLGLHFYRYDALPGHDWPEHYRNGAFIGQHGSWNRSVRVGYKVVFVAFREGRPAGDVEDFLTGFLNSRGEAQGRPVGVIEDGAGALLVADDVGNIIWRVAVAD